MTSAKALAAALATAVGLVLLGASPPAVATEGPRMTIDRAEVSPGDPVIVSLYNFTGQAATVAVCGNLAYRGSADCNMTASQSERIRAGTDLTLTQLFVQPPPVPCPCRIRASTATNDEFAVAPITLVGHPEAPVVMPAGGPLLDVDIVARRASEGLVASLRSSLGGPTRYVVTVSVRNLATERLANVVLSGGASHRLNDDAANLDLDPPEPIEPGQTWQQSVETEVPAPVMGRLTWSVNASGAGPSVSAEQAVSNTPVALYFLLAVLVVDVIALVWRFVLRRRRGEGAGATEDAAGTVFDGQLALPAASAPAWAAVGPAGEPAEDEPTLVDIRT